MKDVAYFIGSCLEEDDCEKFETQLLDYYFSVLTEAVSQHSQKIDTKELEVDWRNLYHVAWTDFHRFIKGWCPEHWKITSYSERISKKVIQNL